MCCVSRNGCPACLLVDNQEHDRRGVSEVVGERVARELYYVPFAAAVDIGVGSASERVFVART